MSKWSYCDKCGVEWYSKDGTHRHFHMCCAYCGHNSIQVHKKELNGFHFAFTEPDYGDGWKCPECDNTVTGIGAKIPIPITYIHGSGMGLSGEDFQEWLKQANTLPSSMEIPMLILQKSKCPNCGYEYAS